MTPARWRITICDGQGQIPMPCSHVAMSPQEVRHLVTIGTGRWFGGGLGWQCLGGVSGRQLTGCGTAEASASPAVRAEVERQLGYLAITLRNAINVLKPRLIVLGGFLGSLYAVAPGHVDHILAHQPLRAARQEVTITRSRLASDLLMIGAAELAFESILSDPTSARSALRGG